MNKLGGLRMARFLRRNIVDILSIVLIVILASSLYKISILFWQFVAYLGGLL